MIPETVSQVEPLTLLPSTSVSSHETHWRELLAASIRTPRDLLSALAFSPAQIADLSADDQGFTTFAPAPFVARMTKANPNDPLLLQVLPQAEEAQRAQGFITDPLAEDQFGKGQGVLHKYHGRALVIASGYCAINCRYCFRRHFPYQEQTNSRHEWQQALRDVSADTSITEVILSGGDPLVQTHAQLFPLIGAIERIAHIKRLRIHSRLPIVLPQRITPNLCLRLAQSRLQVVMVTHANHAQELDTDVHTACTALREANVTLLNQSVLLAGINNDAPCLANLSEALFAYGILPYYLHLPDKVQGTQHFYVSKQEGQAIMRKLQSLLPGYLVPRLMREEPGRTSKTLISFS